MDVLFHAVTGLMIAKSLTGQYDAVAAVAAVLPDIIGATPFQMLKVEYASKVSIKQFLKDFVKYTRGNTFFGSFDRWIYCLTHSLIFWAAWTLWLVYFFDRQWLTLSLSYLSHLFVDVFTHDGEFATRLLYPLSDVHMVSRGWTSNLKVFLSFWITLIVAASLQYFGPNLMSVL